MEIHSNHKTNIVDLVDQANCRQQTALHVAAESCDPEIIQFLLSKGFKTSVPDANGLIPLHVAVSSAGNLHFNFF